MSKYGWQEVQSSTFNVDLDEIDQIEEMNEIGKIIVDPEHN